MAALALNSLRAHSGAWYALPFLLKAVSGDQPRPQQLSTVPPLEDLRERLYLHPQFLTFRQKLLPDLLHFLMA